MEATKTLLFVYGTLKRGLRNHHLMAGQQFLGEVTTEPRYRVVDLGAHPGLILDEANGVSVLGEVWGVDDRGLAALDEFEEVPGPFVRAGVAITGRSDLVYAYFLNKPVAEGARTGDRWPM